MILTAASAKVEPAEKFLEILHKLIMEENDLPEQISNMDDKFPILETDDWNEFHLYGGKTNARFQGFWGQDDCLAWELSQRLHSETLCDLAQWEAQGLRAYQ